MSVDPLDILKDGIQRELNLLPKGDAPKLVAAAMELILESEVEYEGEELLLAVLQRVAKLGSIKAVAIIIEFGFPKEDVSEAITSVVHRNAELREAAEVRALTLMFEEWAEEEVKAGRMRKTVDPETGQALYQTVRDEH